MSVQQPAASRSALPLAEYYDRDDSDNTCFLCNNPRFSVLVRSDHYGIPITFQRCECGLVKQTPMPNEAFFEWFFNSESFFRAEKNADESIWGYHDYFSDEPSRMATSRYRYWRLRSVFERKTPQDILKIGPATGTFLHVANQHGHRAMGCDISGEFIAWAKEHYGVRIDQGRFEQQGYADGQFDTVLLLNVVENLPKPLEVIREVRRVLKPDGRFILNYVAMEHNIIARLQRERYSLYRPPITYVFTTETFTRMLALAGLEIERTVRDIRVMTPEKILTLGGWRWPLAVARALRLHRIPFPVYAYPSHIAVVRAKT